MSGTSNTPTKTFTQRLGNDKIYGTGSDGNVVISANTTLTRDMYYNNLTVDFGRVLNTNGFRVFVKGTLTLDGFIGCVKVLDAYNGTHIDPDPVADGTVKGTSSSAIQYRIGGQGGGSTSPGVTALPSYLYKDINFMSGGIFSDPVLGQVIAGGGSKGTTGSSGATVPAYTNSDSWLGKAGKVGSDGTRPGYTTTVGVPGGRGNPGADGTATGATPGIGGAGGSGGQGGAVVVVAAKTIVTNVSNAAFVSNGISGSTGSAGSTGSGGTAGASGSAAPNYSHANPDGRTHNHTDHFTNHSDRHAHATNAHYQQHVQEHHAVHLKGNTSHVTGPNHHTTPHHHGSPHWHHNGSYHHPHNDGPHGGGHHWGHDDNPGHWWHAYYQVSHGHGLGTRHQKPNGHHSAHNGPGNGSWRGRWWHGSIGGHDGHAHAHYGLPAHDHTHKPAHHHEGGGSHASHAPANHSGGVSERHQPNWHHHHVAPTVYTGGAGGVNDGVNFGKAAPAVTGQAGKRGGAGGGGAILIVTDSISPSILYYTDAGYVQDSDNYSATSGSTYVLLNV